MNVQRPDILKRLVAARTALVLDKPFYASLAPRLLWKEDLSCRTLWTDGRHLGYNPAFVETLSHAQLQTGIAHEVGHCMAGHPWRRSGRDFARWNEACDRAINPPLRDEGYVLPDGALFELEPTHLGKSAEWIFDRIPIPPPGDDSAQAGGAGGEQDADQEQEDEQKAGSDSGESGDGDEQSDDEQSTWDSALGEVRDAPTATSEDGIPPPNEEEWRQATHQAVALGQARGDTPGGLDRFARQVLRSTVDWRAATRRFAQEVARGDYSWAFPNTRYLARGLYLPALRSARMGPLAVITDVSGSIDQVLYDQFVAEVRTLAEELKPRRVVSIQCDAAVQRVDVFEEDEPVELPPAPGGGGTDFRPAFAEVERMEEPPACVIYLTDLYGTFPEQDPGIPTLWVTGRESNVPVPFGEVVNAG